MRRTACVIASVATIAGCGGSGHSATRSASASRYLATLALEQRGLAAAERAIPVNPRTPAALARSIRLLARAVGRLGDDLSATAPPAAVRPAHGRLVAIARSYAASLSAAAQEATRPGRESAAASALVSSTNTASSSFTRTVSEINATLKH
jgi:hypothetical protein